MQMHITPNNRLASLGTIGLLFLAGIAGMVFLLPANAAHAASPTVSLSTISSGVLTAATSGTVGSTLVITGNGFAPSSAVTITTTVGATTTAWLSTSAGCTVTNGGVSNTATKVDSLVATTGTNNGCLITDGKGSFQVEVAVPALPGGSQTISVSDGTNTVTSSFTITSKISITYTGNNFGFPEESITPSIALSGFGASETVTVSTPMWTTTSFSCPTGPTGSITCGTGTSVADTTGGSKTITATGGTSALTASTTYTVNPWAAFYNSVGGPTTFSFAGAAPTSLVVEAHGMAAGTIAASSITLGPVGTSHAAVTVGTSGYFTGLVISPTANVPFGQVSAVIGGTTFNYASGNIALSNGVWGGALISSIVGSSSSTGVVSSDASTYKPGTGFTASTTSPTPAQNQIGFFGFGFVPDAGCGGAAGGVITVTSGGANLLTGPTFNAGNGGVGGASGTAVPDCNGALFATATLGDTAYSATATPTSAEFYAPQFAQANVKPANVIGPQFGITPWVTAPATTTVDFTTSITVTAHGFSNTETLALKVGGTAATGAGATCPTSTTGTCPLTGTIPDIAGGSQSVTVTGGSSAQSGTAATVTVRAIASSNGAQTILPDTGSAGTAVVIRTGSTYGIHGLAASTLYTVVWNGISGPTTLGTFTSTPTGGIPVPGVQFTVPGDSSGIHIIDIQAAGGASALFGNTVAGDVAQTIAGYQTAYGDMLFSNTATLQTSPSVAAIGVPEIISGNGLTAGTQYIVTLSSTGLCPASSQVTQPALGSFTATSSGAVPSGTAINMTDTATTTETGTVENFVIQSASNFGVGGGAVAACAQFVLAANAKDNMTTAAAGHSVTLTAHGLATGAVYNVVFNYALNLLGNGYTGTTVGVVAASSTGAGTVEWTVPPGTTPGSYPIQLVLSTTGTSTLNVGTAVLNVPLSISVGGTSGSCTNEGTACMGISGTPTTSKQGGNTIISASYTNNSNAPQTAFIYAVVHNALGQTVEYTTATVSPAAGASAPAQLVLFGLPSGTYSVTLFAVSGSGTALSTTTSVSVTI